MQINELEFILVELHKVDYKVKFEESTDNLVRDNATQYKCYITTLTRSKVNILYEDWDHVINDILHTEYHRRK
ncbi:hypothetical protein CR513_38349, partial [Mucuna pruriens]